MSGPNTWAKAVVKNETGTMIFNVTLKHRYDTDHYDQGRWGTIANGRESSAIEVGYWTGFGRTGYDYWWIKFEAFGKVWTCKTNFYCFLTPADAGKVVPLRVYMDGDNGKMDVETPGSRGCTVSLEGSENESRDLSGWMNHHLATLGNLKLGAIAIPGSHDAGMVQARDCTLACI